MYIILISLHNQKKKSVSFFLISTIAASTVQYNFAMICIKQVEMIINYTNKL